ncbi:MAG: glutathione S-transferase C-terminal domain-containing protein [Pseudomonadota bacterium]
MAFQPRALAASRLMSDPVQAAAFAADRAALTKGSNALSMSLAEANPYFLAHLARLDRQFQETPYLFGAAPVIADFSTYHCLWFVYNNPTLQDLFAPFSALASWMGRMRAFGPGEFSDMTGSEALAIARAASPRVEEAVDPGLDGIEAGEQVSVTPIDYGFDPVVGRLVVASTEDIVVLRDDAEAGELAVHFPRLGFSLART